jgi:hypothetical protein
MKHQDMKKLLFAFVLGMAIITSCGESDLPSKESGDEQVPTPVPNSGPETEAERATNAIKDSTRRDSTGKDSL